MANRIKQGFQEKLIELAVEELFPTKSISITVKTMQKVCSGSFLHTGSGTY